MRIRRKGVALVDSKKGILVVSGRSKIFSLPGGGANKNESRKHATIRELEEETGLKTKSIKYLLSYKGKRWHNHKGISVINYVKVFLVKAEGEAKPKNEIKYIFWWKPDSKINISERTKKIIDEYLKNN
jgi:8-oxo-dGTP diphosphatase